MVMLNDHRRLGRGRTDWKDVCPAQNHAARNHGRGTSVPAHDWYQDSGTSWWWAIKETPRERLRVKERDEVCYDCD